MTLQEKPANSVLQILREQLAADGGEERRNWKHSPIAGPLRLCWQLLHRIMRGRSARHIERASRDLGTTRIVREEKDFCGHFELDTRSHVTFALISGHYETRLIPLIKAAIRPGMHVADIGANVGLFTVLLSNLVGEEGRVLSAEPAASVLTLLRSNILRNELSNVSLFSGAITQENASYDLHSIEGNEEYSSLGTVIHPGAPRDRQEQMVVQGETLDSLVERFELRLGFIKIDVEGAEELVLRGAGRTLREHRPILLSEMDHTLLGQLNCSVPSLFALLEEANYRVFDAISGKELQGGEGSERLSAEIVALPQEHIQ
jgi:FkbM family methyltransferase